MSGPNPVPRQDPGDSPQTQRQSRVLQERKRSARSHEAEWGREPSVIIFDLNNANGKPLTLIPKLKTKLKKGTSIIGFLSHVQGDLKQKAHEVGCDMVLPRSAFSQNLPQLLRRHGAPEPEEESPAVQ